MYYVSPANSAYAKLNYDESNKSYQGLKFQQNNSFTFFNQGLVFKSPILSAEFKKLSFENIGSVSPNVIGKYVSEDGFGTIILSKGEKGLVLDFEGIGEIVFLPTERGVWVDQENLSTVIIAEQGNIAKLTLSLKHIKNLHYYRKQ